MGDRVSPVSPPALEASHDYTIGVLSDTHVPDRKRQLDPRIMSAFQQASADLILHAGDISTQIVLDQLGELAPVMAVRGNRDWMMLRQLPPSVTIEINGVSLSLAHGQGGLIQYLLDRLHYYLYGFRLERYIPRLLSSFPDSQVIVFGHIHRPLNQTIDNRLVFNPGSAQVPDPPYRPSLGILRISSDGQVQATLLQLDDIH